MRRTQESKQGMPPRRSRMFGIGTFAALLGVICVIVAGRWEETRATDPQMGRIVYQADAAGRLQRVDAASQQGMPKVPLWKPEVGLLVAHAGQLHLSAAQKQMIIQQDALWTSEKHSLERAMSRSSAGLASESGGMSHQAVTVGQLGNVLQDYSALSALYDRRRQHYWTVATSVLNSAQLTSMAKTWPALSAKSNSAETGEKD